MNASKPTNLLKDSVLAELIAAISLNEKSLPLAMTRVALCELQERRKADAGRAPVVSEFFISGVRDEDGDCTAVEDAAAQFWTVYRRNEDGTCDALMDFMSRESAETAIKMVASQVEPQTESSPILTNQQVTHWSELRSDNFPEHTISTRQQVGGGAWLDWNQLSALGLIIRINKEILHPMGLALFRNPETGMSEGALIAPDGRWSYSEKIEKGGAA